MLLSDYLLLEDKVDYIATQQENPLLKRAHADHSVDGKLDARQIVELLKKADPANGKFLQWIVNMYLAAQFKMEDTPRIHNELKEFIRVRAKLDKKDINQYKKLPELYRALEPYADAEVKSGKQQKKEISDRLFKNEHAVLVYKDNQITVITPKTVEASCYFGQGTKWCTSAKENNMFIHYNHDGPLYIVQTPTGKYQFHFETDQFMDEQDHDIDVGALAKKYPSLYKAFDKIATEHKYLPLVKNPPEEMILFHVEHHADTLIKHVDNPSDELIMKAIKRNGYVIKYLKQYSHEMALEAVKENGMALRYVEHPSTEIEMAAVKQEGMALQFVIEPTPAIIKAAITQNGRAIAHVVDPSPELEIMAVKQSGYAIGYVKKQTPELIRLAVDQNAYAINSITKENDKEIARDFLDQKYNP